jgi:glycosyltransferase involved in cell wall biosynthesis
MLRLTSLSPSTPAPVVCLSANTTWYIVNFRMRLIECLQAEGWRVVVYAPADRHVATLAARGIEHVPMHLVNGGTNLLRETGAIARIYRTLSILRPDVILTFTPKINIYVSLAARALSIPVLANISGLGRAFVAGGWLEIVSKLLYRQALRWPSMVFFQNEEDRTAFVGAGLVAAERTQRLPGSGVDVDRFTPRERDPHAAFHFLLVARLLWDKGVGEFVEAARIVRARHPAVEFALAGFLDVDNPSAVPRESVEAWDREGVVRYLGSFDDMVPVYGATDCVVLPSYYREGVPRSLLEAASMGKPVITTDSVGCRDTVADGVTGRLVRPRDVDDLAGAMLSMVEQSQDSRREMGEASRERALRLFDERIVLSAYRQAMLAVQAKARIPVIADAPRAKPAA